jgi:hypothetical protein
MLLIANKRYRPSQHNCMNFLDPLIFDRRDIECTGNQQSASSILSYRHQLTAFTDLEGSRQLTLGRLRNNCSRPSQVHLPVTESLKL